MLFGTESREVVQGISNVFTDIPVMTVIFHITEQTVADLEGGRRALNLCFDLNFHPNPRIINITISIFFNHIKQPSSYSMQWLSRKSNRHNVIWRRIRDDRKLLHCNYIGPTPTLGSCL